MTRQEYLTEKSAILGITPGRYKKDMKVNYVILEDGKYPVCWDDGTPVVYGDKEDYEVDLQEGDTIITEQEYFDRFLTD